MIFTITQTINNVASGFSSYVALTRSFKLKKIIICASPLTISASISIFFKNAGRYDSDKNPFLQPGSTGIVLNTAVIVNYLAGFNTINMGKGIRTDTIESRNNGALSAGQYIYLTYFLSTK